MGPTPMKALMLGSIAQKGGINFSHGLHTTVFQAGIYTIKAYEK
jgi:hypothetical protein